MSDHLNLVGVGDVQPGEAAQFRRAQHLGDRDVRFDLRGVEQAVDVGQALAAPSASCMAGDRDRRIPWPSRPARTEPRAGARSNPSIVRATAPMPNGFLPVRCGQLCTVWLICQLFCTN